jgi:hypothetical protein
MRLSSTVKSSLKWFVRFIKPVQVGSLGQTAPVSLVFGMDRGTPIDRFYIDQFLSTYASAISGRALEVGDIKYLRKYGKGAVLKSVLVPNADVIKSGSDIEEVVIADLTVNSSLPAQRFDWFVCTQTLNFIYDIRSAIAGAYKLLAPGGHFVGTVAGISQISQYDMERWGDYWRFTPLSLQRAIREAFGPEVIVESFGNALAAQLFLQGVAVEDLPDASVLNVYDKNYPVTIGFYAVKHPFDGGEDDT